MESIVKLATAFLKLTLILAVTGVLVGFWLEVGAMLARYIIGV